MIRLHGRTFIETVEVLALTETEDKAKLCGRWEQDEKTVSGYSIFEGLTCDDGLYTDFTFKALYGY